MKRFLQRQWHDLFYSYAPSSWVDFAMTCAKATESTDLPEQPQTNTEQFRYRLHLSLCRACDHYLATSKLLKQHVRTLVENEERAVPVRALNQELAKKYCRDGNE